MNSINSKSTTVSNKFASISPTKDFNSFSTTLCSSWNKPNTPKKASFGRQCLLAPIYKPQLI